MIFKFLLLSEEVENYSRELEIDADDTFLDLHKLIMKCNGYEEGSSNFSFFLCNDWWKKKEEISLHEIDKYSDEDSYVMEEEVLSDWLEDEKDKLIFIFDYPNNRGLFMELSEIVFGENLSKGKCLERVGEAPIQFLQEEEPVTPVATPKPILNEDDFEEEEEEEDIYSDDEKYDPDELDIEGFEEVDDEDVDFNPLDESDLGLV